MIRGCQQRGFTITVSTIMGEKSITRILFPLSSKNCTAQNFLPKHILQATFFKKTVLEEKPKDSLRAWEAWSRGTVLRKHFRTVPAQSCRRSSVRNHIQSLFK